MSDNKKLNDNGNHQGEFTLGMGGWAEYTVHMTETTDTIRHDVIVPPSKVIPVIFLPGVMGSNLRMSVQRRTELERMDRKKRPDNRAWRPDDIGGLDVAIGNDMGNWFKNASPAQRQLNFDPNETEVEYYHYSEKNDRFDPEGLQTVASDVRHQNVPDGMPAIPPLMGHFSSNTPDPGADALTKNRKFATVSQIARWRGWSEVMFNGPYGEMLKTAERYLNNIMNRGEISPLWSPRAPVTPQKATVAGDLTSLLVQAPQAFGGTSGAALTKDVLKKIAPCWYPVHAMGYNFIKSNGESALVIADRIRGLVTGYQKRGLKCKEVIIVTHSMGGLLARALIHPQYGKLLEDKNVKVLGIYHNVMPTIGAASAYKRMRFGFTDMGLHPKDDLVAKIFGKDGKHATAILANAPAPLEMLPGEKYGKDWIKIVDSRGDVIWSGPNGDETVLRHVYQEHSAWWRLINPDWVNPANVSEKNGGGLNKVYERLSDASEFLASIETTFHPVTYASYCASAKRPSYGEVVFEAKGVRGNAFDSLGQAITLPPPSKWKLLSDEGNGVLTVRAGPCRIFLMLRSAKDAGDETVPSQRSARHISGTLFEHGKDGQGYEHQGSYATPEVLASMLYSIVRIATTANWSDK
jgi:hypothetical protein